MLSNPLFSNLILYFFSSILGGVWPEIKESNYYNSAGSYKVDKSGSPTLLNSLMYKLCYYRYGEIKLKKDEEKGYDSVRKVVIGNKDIKLKYFEEAYTSERWLVRIYRVLPLPHMDDPIESRWLKPTQAIETSPKKDRPKF